MDVPTWVWWTTILVTVAVLVVDIFVIGRHPHEPSTREVATALGAYAGAAVLFGIGVWYFAGGQRGTEFFAGWITEYSLSVDNLFIFILVMSRFRVPAQLQQSALLVGIVLALVMRGGFIAAGAAAINQFSWVFYAFGGFLVYTAVGLARGANDSSDHDENRLVRLMQRRLPVTDDYHGTRLTVRQGGRRLVTPMLVVVAALGTTDLLFALDSIPAIYGLTRAPYLVLTANIFALMGLRQMYFLIGGLLRRLVYLSYGLAVLLGFIGAKLVLHALSHNELGFLNGGEHVGWAPEIPTWLSLAVIVVVLGVTTVASLVASGRRTPDPRPS